MARKFTTSAEGIVPLSPEPGFFHDAYSGKTIMFWYKVDSTSGGITTWEEGGAAVGLKIRWQNNDNKWRFDVTSSSSTTTITQSDTTLEKTGWHHIACIFNNGEMELLIDTISKGTATHGDATVPVHSADPDGIALGSTAERFYSDMGGWDKALTHTEVVSHFQGLRANHIRPNRLKLYYKMDKPGTIEEDLSGNGHTGTVTTNSSIALDPSQIKPEPRKIIRDSFYTLLADGAPPAANTKRSFVPMVIG